MLYTATILFIMTTIMGLYLSAMVFLKKEKPMAIIVMHGLLSIIGFSILLYYYPFSRKSMALFAIATLFGVMLLYQHLTHKTFTKWFCLAHGVFTIAGLIYLVGLIYNN